MTINAVANLERNDVKGALKIAREHFEADTFRPELGQQLVMLQDNPDKFIEGLIKLEEEYGL